MKTRSAKKEKFITKELSKALMLMSKLRKRFLKDRTGDSRCKYKKTKIFVFVYLKKPKRTTMKILMYSQPLAEGTKNILEERD